MKTHQSTGKPTITGSVVHIAMLLLAALSLFPVRAADGIWTADSDGNWSDTTKWLGGIVADDVNSTAYFTNNVTAIRTVTVDTTVRTNANLVFGDGDTNTPGGWLLTGNTLMLSNTAAKPIISVSAINPPGNTNDAWVSSVLSGAQGFTKVGAGTLVLAGNNTTFTNEGIIVQQGTLVSGAAGGFGPASFFKTNQFDGGMVRLAATPNNHTWLVTANGGTLIVTNGVALNFNGPIIGSGTLSVVASNMLTLGNNTGNVFSNFTGTLDLNGSGTGGNIRLDPGSTHVNLGNSAATFDLGTNNAILFTRYNLAGGTDIFFMGALKGGPNTILRATGQGLAGGSTTIFQVGSLNVPTTFSGAIQNGTGGSGVQASAITKVGTSTLTLTHSNNTYSGVTTISNGTLKLSDTGAITNSASILPIGSGIFDVSAYAGLWTNGANQTIGGSGTITGSVILASSFLSPGTGTNLGRLSFANDLTLSGTLTNLFKTGFNTNDSVQIAGNLNLTDITTVQIAPPVGSSLIPNGTYPLFKWNGALAGDLNNLVLAYPAQVIGSTLVLQTNLVTKTISLLVTNNSAGAITWRGDGVNNFWDHSTPNWRTTIGGATAFSELDAVTFNDTGSNNLPVNLVDTVTPSSITVNNTNRNYSFIASGGKITGVTGLSKNGPGSLSVLEDNDFSGTVSINGGVVQVGDGATYATSGSLGTGSLVNNSTLIYTRSDVVTLASPLLGGGTLIQNGTNYITPTVGTLVLTADSVNNGSIVVSNGVLQLGDGTGSQGSFTGVITNNSTLRYFYNNDATLRNGLSGNGVVNYDAASGSRTYTFLLNLTNSGFNGTMNLAPGIRLHADTGNGGHNLGNGSAVNIPDQSQAWLDTSGSNYNQSFTIAGNGWSGEATPLGALRLFNCTLSGPITMASNSRIGGSSSGATIQGQISGPYQLEILGTSANGPDIFVLTLSPAAGPNTFASTLVTRGVLQAGNTNAFTNAVTLTGQGRMRLNGNDITISSLSGGAPENGTNCLVWNNSVSNAATLTVGTDGSSTFFDGIFGNGNTQPLGLTKVGAGTLSLSAISSNTGPVTVSNGTLQLTADGSFSNSTLITASGGATLDVTLRNDGALNLTSGQTLKGAGTVSGNVNAFAGSIVSPGNSVGTLTVQGNLTLAGLLQMELNRTNTPNNSDRINVTGAATYSGTLSVSNIGPALQVNDTFQLFSTGVSGFAAINIATNDANNKIYTWQNNIATLGSIKVLTVSGGVNTTPTNLTFAVAGNVLTLSWPTDHIGWTLQSQTNNLATGLRTTWSTVAGSTTTNQVSIPIVTTNGTVFFRLVYP